MQLAKTNNQPTNNKHTGMYVRMQGGLCVICESTPNYWVVSIGYVKTIHAIYVVQSLANIDGVAKQQALFGVTNDLL